MAGSLAGASPEGVSECSLTVCSRALRGIVGAAGDRPRPTSGQQTPRHSAVVWLMREPAKCTPMQGLANGDVLSGTRRADFLDLVSQVRILPGVLKTDLQIRLLWSRASEDLSSSLTGKPRSPDASQDRLEYAGTMQAPWPWVGGYRSDLRTDRTWDDRRRVCRGRRTPSPTPATGPGRRWYPSGACARHPVERYGSNRMHDTFGPARGASAGIVSDRGAVRVSRGRPAGRHQR